MSKSQIWLSAPHMSGKEKKFVMDAFDSNWIAPLGPNITGFEADVEKYIGNGYTAAALNSGTAALHLGLIILGVSTGDEVICQSMTFSASANPIRYLGALPVFVDSEKETWNICPIALEFAIKDRLAKGKKPKAIIIVHLYGMPCKIDEILLVSEKYNIPILEDSAEAFGSSYKGKKCGTFGDIGVFSFNGNKIITTSAGGALITREKKTKERAVYLATQAREEALHYQHSEIGYNYRMSNVCAGIGRGQMEVLDQYVLLRRKTHLWYEELFQKKEGVSVLKEPNADFFSNFWLTTIQINPEQTQLTPEILRTILQHNNIESRPVWKPLHLQPVFQDCPFYGASVSENLFLNGLCLPSGSNMGIEDKNRIAETLRTI